MISGNNTTKLAKLKLGVSPSIFTILHYVTVFQLSTNLYWRKLHFLCGKILKIPFNLSIPHKNASVVEERLPTV